MSLPVLFHAPMTAPDHPVPSGDREMARLLLRALRLAGCEVEVASALRSFDPVGDEPFQRASLREAEAEAARLAARHAARPAAARPRLWFTYHCHYKAPDLLGPRVAAALGIPLVVAEGSHAAKRAAGPWRLWHGECERALRAADLHLVLNPADREGLAAIGARRLTAFPPFLDAASWPRVPRAADPAAPLRLLAVAMMRPGDKLASYRLLAEALGALGGGWRLDVAGDGPAREAVEAAFAPFGDRVRFHGAVEDRARLAALYVAADVLAWPAVGEAFGMVFLEAALQGCPAVAGAFGGVPGVVADGRGGVLVPPGDAAAFAAALGTLAADPARRLRLSKGARENVLRHHSIGAAAGRLGAALTDLGRTGPVPR